MAKDLTLTTAGSGALGRNSCTEQFRKKSADTIGEKHGRKD